MDLIIGNPGLEYACKNQDVFVEESLKQLRTRGSREYAQGIIDVYEQENPEPGLVRKLLGLQRAFHNPLYEAARIYLKENGC